MNGFIAITAVVSLFCFIVFLFLGIISALRKRPGKMKKNFLIALASFTTLIIVIVVSPDSESTKIGEGEQEIVDVENEDTDLTSKEKEGTTVEEEAQIDTSVYKYATDVEVIDSRDSTQHINLEVTMSDGLKPGLAAQHVLSQTYDFLEQSDIKGANLVTVGVIQGGNRILQFETNVNKFKPEGQMGEAVLAASKVEKMNSNVKEYGQTMGWW